MKQVCYILSSQLNFQDQILVSESLTTLICFTRKHIPKFTKTQLREKIEAQLNSRQNKRQITAIIQLKVLKFHPSLKIPHKFHQTKLIK